jgi:hypothetical protein
LEDLTPNITNRYKATQVLTGINRSVPNSNILQIPINNPAQLITNMGHVPGQNSLPVYVPVPVETTTDRIILNHPVPVSILPDNGHGMNQLPTERISRALIVAQVPKKIPMRNVPRVSTAARIALGPINYNSSPPTISSKVPTTPINKLSNNRCIRNNSSHVTTETLPTTNNLNNVSQPLQPRLETYNTLDPNTNRPTFRSTPTRINNVTNSENNRTRGSLVSTDINTTKKWEQIILLMHEYSHLFK